MPRLLAFVVICAAFPSLAGCDLAILSTRVFGERRPADELFEWQGRLAAGQHVEIKGVSGTITAAPSTSGLVEVTADRRGARNDPNEVRIAVVEHPAGVTVCAVYPREGNECLPGEEGRLSARRNDVNVAFTVGVPSGVDLVARHVNGAIKASDLGGTWRRAPSTAASTWRPAGTRGQRPSTARSRRPSAAPTGTVKRPSRRSTAA